MDPMMTADACVICHWLDQQVWGALDNHFPVATAAAAAAAAGAAALGNELASIPRRAWEGFREMRGTTDGSPEVRGVRPDRQSRTTPLDLNEIADSYEGIPPDEILDYFEQGLVSAREGR